MLRSWAVTWWVVPIAIVVVGVWWLLLVALFASVEAVTMGAELAAEVGR